MRKGPFNGVLNPGGELNPEDKYPQVDELLDVACSEVVDGNVGDPFHTVQSTVDQTVLAFVVRKDFRQNVLRRATLQLGG